jgi:hypothetical protein
MVVSVETCSPRQALEAALECSRGVSASGVVANRAGRPLCLDNCMPSRSLALCAYWWGCLWGALQLVTSCRLAQRYERCCAQGDFALLFSYDAGIPVILTRVRTFPS